MGRNRRGTTRDRSEVSRRYWSWGRPSSCRGRHQRLDSRRIRSRGRPCSAPATTDGPGFARSWKPGRVSRTPTGMPTEGPTLTRGCWSGCAQRPRGRWRLAATAAHEKSPTTELLRTAGWDESTTTRTQHRCADRTVLTYHNVHSLRKAFQNSGGSRPQWSVRKSFYSGIIRADGVRWRGACYYSVRLRVCRTSS